jgi:predicted ATPase
MEAQAHRSLRPSSEHPEALRLLRTAIGGGDWELARSAAELVAGSAIPHTAEALQERMRILSDLLNGARAGRAHLADSLARVSAAKRFQEAAASALRERQNFAETTES